MIRTLAIAAALGSVVFALPAQADWKGQGNGRPGTHSSAEAQCLPEREIHRRLLAQGYQDLKTTQFDKTTYYLAGRDRGGLGVKLVVRGIDGLVVKVEYDGRKDEPRRGNDRDDRWDDHRNGGWNDRDRGRDDWNDRDRGRDDDWSHGKGHHQKVSADDARRILRRQYGFSDISYLGAGRGLHYFKACDQRGRYRKVAIDIRTGNLVRL